MNGFRYTLYIAIFVLMISSLYAQAPNDWVFDMRPVPYVLTEDDEVFHFEIEFYSDKDVAEIELGECDHFNYIRLNNQPFSSLVLKDDGLGRDAVAGDLIYTSEALKLREEFIANFKIEITACTFDLHMNNGEAMAYSDINMFAGEQNFLIRRFSIDAATVIPELHQLGDSVQYSDYVVNVIGKENFFFELYLEQNVSQHFYDFFPDDRQFIYYVPLHMDEYHSQPQSIEVQTPEQGVDYYADLDYDISDDYGSAGALERFIVLPGGSETNLGAWAHETQHRWAARLDRDLHLSSGHFALGFRIGSTIEQINDTTYQFVDNPDVEYGGTDGCYSDLVMYLAGFGPFENIPFPLQVLLEPQWTGEGANYISHEGIFEVTAADFLNSMGPRIPAFEDARKDFKGVLIVHSEKFLSAREMLFFERYAKDWEDPNGGFFECAKFHTITHGVATIDMRISSPLTANKELAEAKERIRIFPNPTSNNINIQVKKRFSGDYLDIYNVNGVLVKRKQLNALNNEIDISDLSAGLYILRAQDIMLKFVKL